jgi:hypothetical protein
VLVRLECIEDAGVDFLIVTLLFAYVHIYGIVGFQAASRLTLRFGETGSTLDVRLASCTWLRRGVSFSSLVDMIFAMEGPYRRLKKQLANHRCGCMHVGKQSFLPSKALAAT